MKTKKFYVQLTVEIDVSTKLLKSVNDEEWRQRFYDANTDADVASHLAYNLVQGRSMKTLDGFADQPEDAALIKDIRIEYSEESEE